MRLYSVILILGFVISGIAAFWASSTRVQARTPDGVTLMGTLSEWKYPDAKMPSGASMSDGGNPILQSVKCKAILTTPDSFEKVVEFYSQKFAKSLPRSDQGVKQDVKSADAKSIATQDDSQGRTLKLRVIVVNKADKATTLVISRADGENETHIAWSHYMRLDAKP